MARKNTKKKMQQEQAVEPDLFGDDFFSRPPAPPAIDLSWEEPEDAPVIAPDKRRAMHATLAIFSVFAVVLGGFLVYTQLLMPTPVTLSASSSTLALPTAVYEPPPVGAAAPIPEPVVEAAPVVAPAPVIEPAVVAEVVTEPAPVAAPRAVSIPRAPRAEAHATRPAAPRSEPVDQNSLGAQAMRLLNSGHAADARRVATQATQANPERADGWIVLGAANASLGDNEAAKTAYANCTARAMGPRVATCRALAR